jgi:dipeptidyl aminopeptidase/acylaminoacyl peptidase
VPFATQGYAVLENTTIPILGEEQAEPNDTYVEQLVASAQAAIDEGARLGVVDRNRVAVMGHSNSSPLKKPRRYFKEMIVTLVHC